MDHSSLNTTQLRQWVERIQSGDKTAREELIHKTQLRLEKLVRKMLKGFPSVQRWDQTAHVVQNALLRLMRALEQIQVSSVREFYALASVQIRRELLDLARHYQGAHGLGAHHASHAHWGNPESSEPGFDPSAYSDVTSELERWAAFHAEVDNLPATEREVVCLTFYHGWTQQEMAELFGVDERTIRRWWQAACGRLHRSLAGQLPGMPD